MPISPFTLAASAALVLFVNVARSDAAVPAPSGPPGKPNIVYIIADDKEQ